MSRFQISANPLKLKNPAKCKKNKFSKEEDEILIELVQTYSKEWTKIASHLNGRNARQCRDRWNHYLDPVNDQSEWSNEEDQLLLNSFAIHGKHWSLIAKLFPQRTSVNIRNRCLRLINQKIKNLNFIPNQTIQAPIAAKKEICDPELNQFLNDNLSNSNIFIQAIPSEESFCFQQKYAVQQPFHEVYPVSTINGNLNVMNNHLIYNNQIASKSYKIKPQNKSKTEFHCQNPTLRKSKNEKKTCNIKTNYFVSKEHKGNPKIILPPCDSLPFIDLPSNVYINQI